MSSRVACAAACRVHHSTLALTRACRCFAQRGRPGSGGKARNGGSPPKPTVIVNTTAAAASSDTTRKAAATATATARAGAPPATGRAKAMSTSEDVVDHVGFGQAEGRRARRANVADKQMGPKLPHPSVSLVLPLPPPTTTTTTTTTKFGGIESADDAANKNASSSAFADGELRAGTHFNALLWDPVACARFLDDRPWGCVEAFARGVVDGSRCISHLCVGGRAGADNVHIDPAGVCTGKGVLDGDRLERHPLSKPGKALRHNYKVNLAYYGPAGTGQTNNQIIQLKG